MNDDVRMHRSVKDVLYQDRQLWILSAMYKFWCRLMHRYHTIVSKRLSSEFLYIGSDQHRHNRWDHVNVNDKWFRYFTVNSLKSTKIYLARNHQYVQNHSHNTRRLDSLTLNSVCSSRGILHNGNKDETPKPTEAVHTVPLWNDKVVAMVSNQIREMLHRECSVVILLPSQPNGTPAYPTSSSPTWS